MRFLPNTENDRVDMLRSIGVSSMDDLFADIPQSLRDESHLNLPHGLTEWELVSHMRQLSHQNMDADTYPVFLGAGVYDHFSPAVVRHVINRSEFLTSYTPYQPEGSQGTLQAIYEFQSLICALTGMEIANASVYDGASALAEAVIMATEIGRRRKVLLPATMHSNYRRVVETYCTGLDIELGVVPSAEGIIDVAALSELLDDSVAGVVVQQPNFFGCLESCERLSEITHAGSALLIAVVNPISLGILKCPGEYQADIVVGDGQPLGLPLSFGGPSFGFFACRKRFARHMPGRVAGSTIDRQGTRGFVLTLQTREQHIRREKATSNICTSQQLCALAATVYLSALGPAGLKEVAELCFYRAHETCRKIVALPGFSRVFEREFFHEFLVRCPVSPAKINARLRAAGIIGGYELEPSSTDLRDSLLICVTEKRSSDEINKLVDILSEAGRPV